MYMVLETIFGLVGTFESGVYPINVVRSIPYSNLFYYFISSMHILGLILLLSLFCYLHRIQVKSHFVILPKEIFVGSSPLDFMVGDEAPELLRNL